ncbi:hypothetical protein BH10PAT4_BH10PAT4_0150 [soil metagenome]
MIVVSELPKPLDEPVFTDIYESMKSAETAMVENGNDVSRSLFFAALLIFESNYYNAENDDVTAFNFIKKPMLKPGSNIVIARDGDAPEEVKGVGVYTSPRDGSFISTIDQLAVLPRVQRSLGYGSAIADHIETSVASQGGRTIVLIPSNNESASPFYLKRGYRYRGYKLVKDLATSETLSQL